MGQHSQRFFETSPLWLAVQLAAVRIVILWTAMLLYSTTDDWRQVVGYFGLILNSFFEMLLVRGFRGHEPAWTLALTVAVSSTSILLAYAWIKLMNRFRRQ